MRGKTGAAFERGAVGQDASMRPPHECGGKQLLGKGLFCGMSRFNEAPARMRGKTGSDGGSEDGDGELQ